VKIPTVRNRLSGHGVDSDRDDVYVIMFGILVPNSEPGGFLESEFLHVLGRNFFPLLTGEVLAGGQVQTRVHHGLVQPGPQFSDGPNLS